MYRGDIAHFPITRKSTCANTINRFVRGVARAAVDNFRIFGERPSWPVAFLGFNLSKFSIMTSVLISIKVKSRRYDLFFIVEMLGWSLKSSSVRFRTDSYILGLAKKSFSTALGLDISWPLSRRRISAEPSIFDLLFGRSGFIFFQKKPVDGVVEAASAQKSFIALLFIAVTEFLCFLYLEQFKSVATRRNFL